MISDPFENKERRMIKLKNILEKFDSKAQQRFLYATDKEAAKKKVPKTTPPILIGKPKKKEVITPTLKSKIPWVITSSPLIPKSSR